MPTGILDHDAIRDACNSGAGVGNKNYRGLEEFTRGISYGYMTAEQVQEVKDYYIITEKRPERIKVTW